MKKTLDLLLPGQTGTIFFLRGDGPLKRRLVDMGLVPGSSVRVQKYAPLGDPMEIKVKNFNLSLRKSEAAMIELEVSEMRQS